MTNKSRLAISLLALTAIASSCSTKPTPTTTQSVPVAPAPAAPQRFQDTIEYLADDGTPRTAWLEDVEVKFEGPTKIVNTMDPDWRVKNPDGTTPRVKRIGFTATDGSRRLVWVEAHYNGAGQWVTCEFNNSDFDGSRPRGGQEDIWLLDRNRRPFRLTIPKILGPPYVPKFSIER
jgi:hypothetical protein